jgi:hypothetical protein
VGVRAVEARPRPWSRPAGPEPVAAIVVFVFALALLLANGRPVGEPDGSGAAGWIWHGAVLLAGRAGLEMDRTGAAVVGKLLAAVFAALAAAALYGAAARRHTAADGRWSAFALALGTTLTAAAQSWSGEAPATCAVAIALGLLARAEDELNSSVGARAALPLAFAAVLQPTALPLAVALAVAALVRWRASWLAFLAWLAPGALVGAAFFLGLVGPPPSAASAATPQAADPSPLALLVSPAKGAFVFAPVALVGLVGLLRALRRPRRRLWDQPEPTRLMPLACALGIVVHFAWLALAGGWSRGVFWGPRLVAPAWPLALLFLPEGLAALKLLGTALVVLSVGVQALGALAYDGRWDRLQRDARGRLGSATWDLRRSPIAFQWRERVARPSLVGLEGRRLVVRERAIVRSADSGSFVSFASGHLRPTGAETTMEALHLEQGARVESDRLELRSPGDGLAFRVREGARPRRLELRVVGRGQGTVGLAEKSFWKTAHWSERVVSGAFRLRLPYSFAESGAAELTVALRAGGPITLESVALVPPTEPENVIRLP